MNHLEDVTGTEAATTRMSDKRTVVRTPCSEAAASITIEIDGDPRFYTGLARNISSGGIFVHTFTIPAVGTSLLLRFRMKDRAESVEQPAVVAWVRTASDAADTDDVGFGARFLCLPPELSRALDKALLESGPHDFFE